MGPVLIGLQAKHADMEAQAGEALWPRSLSTLQRAGSQNILCYLLKVPCISCSPGDKACAHMVRLFPRKRSTTPSHYQKYLKPGSLHVKVVASTVDI